MKDPEWYRVKESSEHRHKLCQEQWICLYIDMRVTDIFPGFNFALFDQDLWIDSWKINCIDSSTYTKPADSLCYIYYEKSFLMTEEV